MKYPITLGVRILPEHIERLDEVREPLELTRTALVRLAVKEFLERQLFVQTKSAQQEANSEGA